MKLKYMLATMVIAILPQLVGCGSSPTPVASLEQDAFARVEGLSDLASDEEMFATAFVAGSIPENRKDYSMRGYQIVGEPTFDGDTVTMPVKIFGGIVDSASGDRNNKAAKGVQDTEQTWTLQRSDNQWKIKNAPLG